MENFLAEFFVMKKYRRKGVGKAASMKIFDTFTATEKDVVGFTFSMYFDKNRIAI